MRDISEINGVLIVQKDDDILANPMPITVIVDTKVFTFGVTHEGKDISISIPAAEFANMVNNVVIANKPKAMGAVM